MLDGFEFLPAIKARSVMLYTEWKNNEDRLPIWNMSREFLLELAEAKPRQVNYFFGRTFSFPKKNSSYEHRNIFIVNHRKEVAYLCTAFNDKAFFYRARNQKGGKFSQRPKEPVRDPVFFIVAPGVKQIDELAVVKAIHKYLHSYQKSAIPLLADTTICLFSEEKGTEYDNFVHENAKLLAEQSAKQ